MGEIGIDEDRFLYGLKWWQIDAILRGYRKRGYEYQMLTRWQTWALLKGFCGLEADDPKKLISLPCDAVEKTDEPSEEEIQKLLKECQDYNRSLRD